MTVRGLLHSRATRVALGLAVLVLVTAAFPSPPLVDAATGLPVDWAAPTRPVSWLLFAPLFGVWDMLSLLALSQHYAVLATLAALYLSRRIRVARRTNPWDASGAPLPGRTRSLPMRMVRGTLREGGRAVLALLLLLAFYAAGLLVPRPMTGIELTGDRDRLTIDFHSHTRWSHDGWSLFTAERNRAWHEAGGFDAAYVTDHYTWRGYDAAAPDNPARAGERTVLLEGAEIRVHGRPTNILGSRERYIPALDEDSVFMSPEAMADRYPPGTDEPPPTLFFTMPGRLIRVVPFSETVPSGMIGIEINDGSPRGLEQVRSERAEILALADSMDLALIGAANLHGWGRTVASWGVMTIPGWREMRPEALGRAIEEILHRDRRDAVTVVERSMPWHGGAPHLVALTAPVVVFEYARMMSWPERASWLVWLALWGALAMLRGRQVERAARG